jgi:hypothetical protein
MFNPIRMRGGFALSVALAGVSVFHAIGGWHYLVTGHRPETAASRQAVFSNPEVVLFDASVPLDFILTLHQANPARRFIALSESTNTTNNAAPVQVEDLAASMDQVQKVIAQNTVKYVVVSDATTTSDEENSLRAILRSDARFKFLGTFPVQSGTNRQASNVLLYENIEGVTTAAIFDPVRLATVNMAAAK